MKSVTVGFLLLVFMYLLKYLCQKKAGHISVDYNIVQFHEL